ncbi:hypothetical protein JTE90_005935 [Oedothorax gibbosus]|uniref:Uncharacterized protein n=1 Tax=Oedothorax gibbosus TaxID=931172 RepID=A0AAV6TQ77_9ARAC|nr:hypothetical protein JTE90_005935 [Oedothorax gibbosus]
MRTIKSVLETLKTFNLKDMVYWISEAWDEVKSAPYKVGENNYRYTEYRTSRKFNEGIDELLDLAMQLQLSESINKEDIRDG